MSLYLCLTLIGAAQSLTLGTGTNPGAVAVNPVTNKIYVANSSSNSVTVIDGTSDATVTVAVGGLPDSLAVNQTTNKIYVTNNSSGTVTVIDGATNGTATVGVGSLPSAVAVNQTTNKIYVANYGDNTVTVIDGVKNTTATVNVGTNPNALAVNATTNKIYVANYDSASLTVIDGATNSTSSIATGKGPSSVAVNTVTNKIYVANSLDGTVTVMDGVTKTTLTLSAGTDPDAVALDPVANKVYVANKTSNNLTVIDGVTNQTAKVTVGASPVSVTVNQSTGSIYVANRNSSDVTAIDGSTGIATTVATGKSPVAVAVNQVTGQFYVANFDSNNVTVAGSAATQTAKMTTAAGTQGGFTLSATSGTANALSPSTYFSYGDSITYGTGASVPANQYTNLLAADLAAALTNRGVGGREACDVAQIIMANDNPPASLAPLQTLMVGTNDGYWSGTGAYEANYKACHQASLAWLAIPSSQKTPAQSCAQTGVWQPDTTYLSGIAAQSFIPGSGLSCPVTSYGGPIYLWYRVTDTNHGAFLYSVDGGAAQSANSFANPPIATWFGGIDGVFLIRLTGLAAGAHRVQVTVTASSVSILGVGSLNPAMQPGAPQVFAGGVIRYQYDNGAAASTAYDADAAADVALLSGDGLPVYFVPVRNFVNAYSDMADGFHPDDAGHLHLRDAFESVSQFPLNSPATFSSTVTVNPGSGFNSGVTLATSGWPSGITGTFGTNPATNFSTVNISVAPGVAPGPYTLAVTGTSGGVSASTSIPITVAARPSFVLNASATTASATTPGTSTVTVTPYNGFVPAVEFTPVGWPSGITATFAPGLSTSSSVATISVTASVAPGFYNLTLKAFAGDFSATTSIGLTVTGVPGITSSATFSMIDTSTQGSWTGTYGGDGYMIAADTTNLPSYAGVTFTVPPSTFTWAGVTTDVRGMQASAGSTTRLATMYYPSGTGNLTMNINLTDGATHQVAIYFLDWNSTTRLQTVSITDAATGIVLDNRVFSQLYGGEYGVWNIKGNVIVNVIENGPGAPVASGFFFGPAVVTGGGNNGPVATPPIISNVSVTNVTTTTATISWSTDQASNSSVNLSGGATTSSSSYVTNHSVTLTNLTPGTTYDFSVTSTSASSGTARSATATFTTTAASSTPPNVGYVEIYGITGSGATITWSTDVPSDTQLNYGPTPSLGTLSPDQSTLASSHQVVLTGLASGTTYYFVAQSKGANGATGYSTSYSFTTAGAPAAPSISNIQTSVTANSATITWTTDEASTGQVNYGVSSTYSSSSTLTTALTTTHSVTLTNLLPGTTYNFDVVSSNASQLASTSTNSTFQTAGSAPGPVITSVAASNVTSSTALITWTTDQASTSLVTYGTMTASSATLTTSHSVTLTGLTPNTQYSFIVTSVNAGGVASTSGSATFTTQGQSATAPYVGYVAYWGITNSGITISWSSSVPANTQLNYGTTPSLGTLSPVQSALANGHEVVLTGLAAGTTYYFVAQSTGANGATGYSTTYSFTTSGSATTTPAPVGNAAGPVVSGISVGSITSGTAVVTWTTDQASTTVVKYGTQSVSNSTLVTNHQAALTGLTPNTNYSFTVTSVNASGVSTTSSASTFTTPGPSAAAPQVGYVAYWSVTSSGITVSWSTNVPSTTAINYGTTTAMGTLTPVQTALTSSHGVVLTGLQPNTVYYFQPESTDANGNTGFSPIVYTFTTGN